MLHKAIFRATKAANSVLKRRCHLHSLTKNLKYLFGNERKGYLVKGYLPSKKIYLSQTTQQDIFRALQMQGSYRKPRSSLIKLTRLSKFLSIPLIATVAASPARTTRQAARFLFTDVTVTRWKEPSCDGPRRS